MEALPPFVVGCDFVYYGLKSSIFVKINILLTSERHARRRSE